MTLMSILNRTYRILAFIRTKRFSEPERRGLGLRKNRVPEEEGFLFPQHYPNTRTDQTTPATDKFVNDDSMDHRTSATMLHIETSKE